MRARLKNDSQVYTGRTPQLRWRNPVVLLISTFVVASASQATLIEVEFSGVITEVAVIPAAFAGSVSPGTSFVGRYVVDTSLPARAELPGLGFFRTESLVLDIGGERLATAPPRPILRSGVLDVVNNGGISSAQDSVSIRFSDSLQAFGTINGITLDFRDPIGIALDDASIVLAPDLSIFSGELRVGGQESICFDNFDFACIPPELSLVGEINALQIIPEPTTSVLFAVGLALLSMAKGTRHSSSSE